MAVRDILLEKDFAFEDVNSFSFILFNDIKRILHVSSFRFILFNDLKSHPQTQRIIKRREIQYETGRKNCEYN